MRTHQEENLDVQMTDEHCNVPQFPKKFYLFEKVEVKVEEKCVQD